MSPDRSKKREAQLADVDREPQIRFAGSFEIEPAAGSVRVAPNRFIEDPDSPRPSVAIAATSVIDNRFNPPAPFGEIRNRFAGPGIVGRQRDFKGHLRGVREPQQILEIAEGHRYAGNASLSPRWEMLSLALL